MKKFTVSHAKNFTLNVPAIGFGAMGISEFYGTADKDESIKAVHTALECGINHFDTADGYAFGENEKFLGQSLILSDNTRRKKLIIASKAGILRDKDDPSIRGICIAPDYLYNQLNRSLNNLGTYYLDIFYVHRLPPRATEKELTTLAHFLLKLKNEGKVLAVGLSEPKLEQLKLIHDIAGISFVQSEYNLLERGIEKNGMLAFCKTNKIQFVAYSPLCRGMLTDAFNPSSLEPSDFRRTLPKFNGKNYEENLKIVQALKEVSHKKGISLPNMSIAWLIEQDVVVIPGMTKPSRVKDAISAYDVILTKADLEQINTIASIGVTKGTRYSLAAMEAYGFED